MILRPCNTDRNNATGAMSEAERGHVYRLFAYFGGPLVLDALVSGMVSTTMPRRAEDVGGWFEDALNQLVRTSALAAAASLRLNQRNMMQLVRLALRRNTATAATRAKDARPSFKEWAGQVSETIGWQAGGRAVPELDKTQRS
jgi:hypothetical protein